MLRKIALSGMKGRKKDTFLLSFVIGLSFIFIIIATIFHASSEGTKIEERTAMFGSWHLAYLGGNQEMGEKLKGKDGVEELAISRLLGRSNQLGMVGTINGDLEDLGDFTMYEGRMPEKDNEIALELNQLSFFSSDVNIGDTIAVEIIIPIFDTPEDEIIEEEIIKLIPEIERKYGLNNILHEINNYGYHAMDYYEKEEKGELTSEDRKPLYWPSLIRYGFTESIGRNEQSLESFDGTKVIIKTSDKLMTVRNYIPQERKDSLWSMSKYIPPEPIDLEASEGTDEDQSLATLISQYAHITRDMVVTGIIQNYSSLWDSGDEPLANSFVTEEAGKAFMENGFLLTREIDVSDYEVAQNIFIGSGIPSKEFFDKYEDEFEGLRRNISAYPDMAGTTESTLTFGILAAIFVATIFAVFQIYLTQTRRRTRRIALLKSIGGVNSQIRSLLLWELVYLLLLTLPLSVGLGFGLSKLVLLFMNKYGNTVLNMHIDYTLSLFGMGLGISAVFIGMMAPMLMSSKVALTGSISQPTRKKSPIKARLKVKKVNLNMKIQSFRGISIKNIKYNKGKTLLTASLYTIATLVLLGTIFLSYIFFGDYLDKIVIKDKPAYSLEFNHALGNKKIPILLDSIYEVDGISKVELYKAGKHAYLWHDNIGKNEVYSKFKDLLPPYLLKEHFGINDTKYVNIDEDNEYLIKDSIVANIYGIDVDYPLYSRFTDSLTKGQVDREKFERGEEVILLLPIYKEGEGLNGPDQGLEEIASSSSQADRMERLLRNSESFNLSYDFRYANNYLEDETILVGDTIHLTIPTEDTNGPYKTNDVRFIESRVAGIVHYFPDKAIWPFGETVENPVVIGSYSFLGGTHPVTLIGKGDLSVELIEDLRVWQSPTRYGETYAYIYEDKNADQVNIDINLKRIARENEAQLRNYREENKKIFAKALNMAAIVTILGISVAIITLIILYNTTLSKLEQERERIGTFQALGVTNKQFRGVYLSSGIGYGLFALIVSHIILGLTLVFTFIGGGAKSLYLYPWKIHIITSITTFLIIVLTYYMPIRKIIKNQPIDNIRNLGR